MAAESDADALSATTYCSEHVCPSLPSFWCIERCKWQDLKSCLKADDNSLTVVNVRQQTQFLKDNLQILEKGVFWAVEEQARSYRNVQMKMYSQ